MKKLSIENLEKESVSLLTKEQMNTVYGGTMTVNESDSTYNRVFEKEYMSTTS